MRDPDAYNSAPAEVAMTQLLDKAVLAASKLPEQDQDALAAILLAEIESERRWAESFEKSQDLLSELATEARAEHSAGKTAAFPPK
jgi:hypothetical protein